MSGVRAAEDLNRSGLMSPLLGSLILGYTVLYRTAAGGRETKEPKYSVQGQRQRLLSGILIIYLTVPSKLDSFVLGHQSHLIWWKVKQLRLHCLPLCHQVDLVCLNTFLPFIMQLKTYTKCCQIGKIWAAMWQRMTCSETESVWCCSSYL